MMNEKIIRDAYNTLCKAAVKTKGDSVLHAQLTSMAGALGWVLEEPGHTDNTQRVLAELRKHVGEPVYSDGKN